MERSWTFRLGGSKYRIIEHYEKQDFGCGLVINYPKYMIGIYNQSQGCFDYSHIVYNTTNDILENLSLLYG